MRFKRRKLEVIPPFVSMADIVFNLVLFFLIMAKTQDDSHIEWKPAQDTGAQQIKSAKISISVDKNNKVYLNGRHVGIAELTTGVAQELGDKPAGQRAVLLKIHNETLAATFEPIMEAVSNAGGEVYHVIDDPATK